MEMVARKDYEIVKLITRYNFTCKALTRIVIIIIAITIISISIIIANIIFITTRSYETKCGMIVYLSTFILP